MTVQNLVRTSRDGDQFHYLWAARQCLKLIQPNTDLVAISIEGSAINETDGNTTSGEELIDVAEYCGDINSAKATGIIYSQLKHSTVQIHKVWTPSELKHTIEGFYHKYKNIKKTSDNVASKIRFQFISNRPMHAAFELVKNQISNGEPVTDQANLNKWLEFTGEKTPSDIQEFCQIFEFKCNESYFTEQKIALHQELRSYLPDIDCDAPILLKDLVCTRATSENTNPIEKYDVLQVLKTNEEKLLPSKCLIRLPDQFVMRESYTKLIDSIIQANNNPVLIHATGGVGKSTFSKCIERYLPVGSIQITYDCFGNGDYRKATQPRHGHSQGCVQIANELSSMGLCDLLIPSTHANPSDYLKALLSRLRQSVASIKSANPNALLCIVIDAADNAEMAAQDRNESPSFAKDLIREEIPEGVRLVFTTRTHRKEYIAPPANTLIFELIGFEFLETKELLKFHYSEAADLDVLEFYRLTNHNPRIQATILEEKLSLPSLFQKLGPNPVQVEDLFEKKIDKIIADALQDKGHLLRICTCLASLRPMIPIEIIEKVSGVNRSMIMSFISDMGRPLVVLDNTVQFYDEPAETWFREKYKPKHEDLLSFIETLKPLTSDSAYAASTIPQLMLESNQLDSLIELALSSETLPSNEIERRDVELQRVNFALKASLKNQKYLEATKLALKAANEKASHIRQQSVIQNNPDFSALMIDADILQGIVHRDEFADSWMGSRYLYSASLFSVLPALKDLAQSHLRVAENWMRHYIKHLESDSDQDGWHTKPEHEITEADWVEYMLTLLSLYGEQRTIDQLLRSRDKSFGYKITRYLAKRLVDQERYECLEKLAEYAKNHVHVVLAILFELNHVSRTLPKPIVYRAVRVITKIKIIPTHGESLKQQNTLYESIPPLIEAAVQYDVTLSNLQELTKIYPDIQPPYDLTSSHPTDNRDAFLKLYALHQHINNLPVLVVDLLNDSEKEEYQSRNSKDISRSTREVNKNLGVLMPWYELWASLICSKWASSKPIDELMKDAREESHQLDDRWYLQEYSSVYNETFSIQIEILAKSKVDCRTIKQFISNHLSNVHRKLTIPTLIDALYILSRIKEFKECIEPIRQYLEKILKDTDEQADTISNIYVALSRAMFAISKDDAQVYFLQAIQASSKLGEENNSRYVALLFLAKAAANSSQSNPRLAYELSRAAELTYKYVVRDKHFLWDSTVETLIDLAPESIFEILGRWQDRNIDGEYRTIPAALEYLESKNLIHPNLWAACIGFQSVNQYKNILDKTLSTDDSVQSKQRIFDSIIRYAQFSNKNPNFWRYVSTLKEKYGLISEDFISRAKFLALKATSQNIGYGGGERVPECIDWSNIFINPVVDESSYNVAYEKFKAIDGYSNVNLFFSKLFEDCEYGQEIKLITIIDQLCDEYDFRYFLNSLNDSLCQRQSIKDKLWQAIVNRIHKTSLQCTRNILYSDYEFIPFDKVAALTGRSQSDMAKEILNTCSFTVENLGHENLFDIVGILALTLTIEQAQETLICGLNYYESIYDSMDSDGQWMPTLSTSSSVIQNIAGYVWRSLGQPQASKRWEGAHVVRLLCELEQNEVIAELVKFAQGEDFSSFVDQKFVFYHLHALQWFLLGCRRASMDKKVKSLLPCTDFFINTALSKRHIIIREMAKQVVLNLAQATEPVLEENVLSSIKKVNQSQFKKVESKVYTRGSDKEGENDEVDSEAEVSYKHGYYMAEDWFPIMGELFGLSKKETLRIANSLIPELHAKVDSDGNLNDARYAAKAYGHGMDTDYHHFEYPKTDDLKFYYDYHNLMDTAALLLDTRPLHQEPNYPDEFQEWFFHHMLTSANGLWLFEHRTPHPSEWPAWKEARQDKNFWPWSVNLADFDRALYSQDGWLNVRGCWRNMGGSVKERIEVESILVEEDYADQIAAAYQAAKPSDAYLPVYEKDEDIVDFQKKNPHLKIWLRDQYKDTRADIYDYWSGGVRLSLIEPHLEIIRALNLSFDANRIEWSLFGSESESKLIRIRFQNWGEANENTNYREYETGRRLQIHQDCIQELCRKTGMSLLLSVKITRDNIDYSGKRDYLSYEPYHRVFVLK